MWILCEMLYDGRMPYGLRFLWNIFLNFSLEWLCRNGITLTLDKERKHNNSESEMSRSYFINFIVLITVVFFGMKLIRFQNIITIVALLICLHLKHLQYRHIVSIIVNLMKKRRKYILGFFQIWYTQRKCKT